MRNGFGFSVLVFAAIAAIAATAPALAHHSAAALYDVNETIEIEGRLIAFFFRSPHSEAIVEAPDADGEMQRWTVAWNAARQLSQAGITRDFFRPGEQLVITGNPGRNPDDHIIVMRSLYRPSDGFEWGNRPGETFD